MPEGRNSFIEAVMSELAKRKYDSILNVKKKKAVISVNGLKFEKKINLEVRTRSKPIRENGEHEKYFGRYLAYWLLDKKQEDIRDINYFYCFVGKDETNRFRFFIVVSTIVANYIRKQHQFWLDADLAHKEPDLRRFRIGFSKEKYLIPTPAVDQFENNWEFKDFLP